MSDTSGNAAQPTNTFKFCVGEAGEVIEAPADLLAKLSVPINNLINGNFREAREKEAFWYDTEPNTFRMLLQYARVGNYDAKQFVKESLDDPDVQILSSQPAQGGRLAHRRVTQPSAGHSKVMKFLRGQKTVQELGAVHVSQSRPIWSAPTTPEGQRQTLSHHAASFHYHTNALPMTTQAIEILRQTAANNVAALKSARPELEGIDLKYDHDGSRLDSVFKFTQHFNRHAPSSSSASSTLVESDRDAVRFAAAGESDNSRIQCLFWHAKVYALADEKMIDGLKTLAADQVHSILRVFPLDRARVSEMLDLARLVFDRTAGEDDQLRCMLAEYFALQCKKDNVGASAEFMDAMEGGGEFVRFFWKNVFWRRLNH